MDDHHTVEDIGICLGLTFAEALGDMRGINRYGSLILPMDEALILTAVDISGRAHLSYDADIPSQKIGTFDAELVKEFWLAFRAQGQCHPAHPPAGRRKQPSHRGGHVQVRRPHAARRLRHRPGA